MKKRPLQIQSEFFEKVWTNADLDAVFEYFDGQAGGLGASEPLDPVGYIDFYHALSSVVKDPRFEFTRWIERDDRLYLEFVMKARARQRDKAIFWHGSAIGHYSQGKIAGGENFLDFVDLFRQLELVPEQALELGLAGEEILQLQAAGESLGPEFRRLFWPGYLPALTRDDHIPSSIRDSHLPSSEQLEVLFNSATFGMVIADQNDWIVDMNPQFESLIDRTQKTFSDLVTGKGKEAERRAREALVNGEIPSYRILLNLQGKAGLERVWVSAVLIKRPERPVLILRSVERDELIDDLVGMHEDDRRLLTEELTREVLEPVLELWSKFSSRAVNDPSVRVRCLEMASRLADQLRDKIRNLRNPILEGVPLSEAWPELQLDPALDLVDETVALLAYRLVGECTSYYDAELSELDLTVDEDWIRGSIPIAIVDGQERLNLLRNLCDLVGGRVSIVRDGEERSVMRFWLPWRG